MSEDKCRTCAGTGWVCENHRDLPWEDIRGVKTCGCGAGAPCGSCNLRMASAGFTEPLRELVERAVSFLGSAERETIWGDPLFGPSPSEEIANELARLLTTPHQHGAGNGEKHGG